MVLPIDLFVGDTSRLQNDVSKTWYGQRLIQQANSTVERRWTQVHVPLRHAELFLLANAVLVVAALSLASVGWKRATQSLVILAATRVNAIFFHILPTVVQRRVSPGLYTAALLYLPFSSWAFLGAWRDGIPARALAVAFAAGTLMMLAVVLAARSAS